MAIFSSEQNRSVIMSVQQPSLESLEDYYQKNKEEIKQDFFKFLQFQSISSEATFAPQVRECASWLQEYVGDMGFRTETWESAGHPVLFAEKLDAGPKKPTLLIYNHYDVQPVDPLEEWTSEPFSPQERNGKIYARGAQDNKGQCFYVLQAIKILQERDGKLPVNIKLVIEGEEECGSGSLSKIIRTKTNELKSDFLVVVDVGMHNEKTPAVTLGVRGIVCIDLEVTGSNIDLHSGFHGGIAYNPIHALVQLLSKLRDGRGTVLVPGFYDNVQELDSEERSRLTLDFDENRYKDLFAAEAYGGEMDYIPKERAWVRPTLEINGIRGGYTGDGFKTVIPAKATAKLSCRLVPNMDAEETGNLVVKFLVENAPKGCNVQARVRRGTGRPARVNPKSKIVKAFSQAYEEVFQTSCAYILSGGSIPIATGLAEASRSDLLFVGLGLDSDKIHAPNEHFGLDRFAKGVVATARAIELLGGNTI